MSSEALKEELGSTNNVLSSDKKTSIQPAVDRDSQNCPKSPRQKLKEKIENIKNHSITRSTARRLAFLGLAFSALAPTTLVLSQENRALSQNISITANSQTEVSSPSITFESTTSYENIARNPYTIYGMAVINNSQGFFNEAVVVARKNSAQETSRELRIAENNPDGSVRKFNKTADLNWKVEALAACRRSDGKDVILIGGTKDRVLQPHLVFTENDGASFQTLDHIIPQGRINDIKVDPGCRYGVANVRSTNPDSLVLIDLNNKTTRLITGNKTPYEFAYLYHFDNDPQVPGNLKIIASGQYGLLDVSVNPETGASNVSSKREDLEQVHSYLRRGNKAYLLSASLQKLSILDAETYVTLRQYGYENIFKGLDDRYSENSSGLSALAIGPNNRVYASGGYSYFLPGETQGRLSRALATFNEGADITDPNNVSKQLIEGGLRGPEDAKFIQKTNGGWAFLFNMFGLGLLLYNDEKRWIGVGDQLGGAGEDPTPTRTPTNTATPVLEVTPTNTPTITATSTSTATPLFKRVYFPAVMRLSQRSW